MLEPEQTANCWFSNYCQYSSFGCVQSAVKHIPYFSSQSGKAVMSPPGSSPLPETDAPAGNDEAQVVQVRAASGSREPGPDSRGKGPRAEQPGRLPPPERAVPMPGDYGVMGDDGSIDYSVHEAWNEATNVYLVVILVSFGLFMYAKRNKRKIMRIFSVPPTAETLSEPNFYDTMSKIRLRQQLEMYSISRKYDHQQAQNQADSVQLSLE